MKVTGMWERLPHSIRQQGECETKRTVHPSGAHRQEGAIHHHASLGTASLHTLGSPSCCSESWKTSLRSLSFCAIVYPLLSLFLPLYCFFFFFSFCLLPNDLESSGTASWSWREAESRATLEWLIREIRVVLLSSPYVFCSKQERLFVG